VETRYAPPLVARRFAIWQTADDHRARPVADLGMVETTQVFAGEALVQVCDQLIGGGQRRGEICAGKQQAGDGCVEFNRAPERSSAGRRIDGRGVWQIDCQRIDLVAR